MILPHPRTYIATPLPTSRGRPKLNIPRSQVQHLLENGFTCPQIASIFGVSTRTVHRRLEEYNFSVSALYSQISDAELDALINDVKQQFPSCGYTMMAGHLLSRGYRVQQIRVRAALVRADRDGVATRWCYAVQRRTYNVYGPLALWHIDGHHKLIR